MSHDPHKGPDGAVLFDDCQECDYRASKPMYALNNMDSKNFERLFERMLSVEIEDGGRYLTANEAKVGNFLFQMYDFVSRHKKKFVEAM